MAKDTDMHLATSAPLPCAQCGTAIRRPSWSERTNERQARHLWNCRDCGYVFETLVVFSAEDTTPLAA